jgi:hypothetical protein
MFRYPRGLARLCRDPFAPDDAPGISPFAGLLPKAGGADVSMAPGPRAVNRLSASTI